MKDEILPLTSLRFFAAFYIFIFHVHTRWPITSNAYLSNIFNAGAIGMTIFFMLSGFVLTYRYQNSKVSYREYIVNRFARIYPIYIIAALVIIPWFGINLLSSSGNQFVKGILQSIVLIVSNIFMFQAWLPQTFHYWNNGGNWSISTEAFFYIIFPFLLNFISGKSTKQKIQIGLTFYFLSIFPSFTYCLFSEHQAPWVFYSIPIFRLPEFIVGMCTCLLLKSISNIKVEISLFLSLMVFFIYLGIGKFSFLHVGVGHNWIAVPIISLMFIVLFNSKGIFSRILSIKPLIFGGKISYCFFSFQALVIMPFMSYHDQIVEVIPILSNNKILFLFLLSELLLISSSAYIFIENPMHAFIKMKYSKIKLADSSC